MKITSQAPNLHGRSLILIGFPEKPKQPRRIVRVRLLLHGKELYYLDRTYNIFAVASERRQRRPAIRCSRGQPIRHSGCKLFRGIELLRNPDQKYFLAIGSERRRKPVEPTNC
jgi:hypothetical protein